MLMSSAAVILIVDDDPRGCEALEGLLTGQGYDLAFAGNGREALDQAESLVPDLILLDVMMPELDGFEVCRRLRANARLAEVPVIMVTALDDQDSRLQGIEAGADDFISKPFNRMELRARVRTITRLNRYRRLTVERAQSDWMIEQAEEGYLMINERDEILFANAKARLYLDLAADMSGKGGELFLNLAKRNYTCEPEEAWHGWPELAGMTPAARRYLVRRERPSKNACWILVSAFKRAQGEGMTSWLVRLHEATAEVLERRNRWILEKMLHHRLRNPINAVRAPLELLVRDEGEPAIREVKEFAQSALQGVKRISSEIKEIIQLMETPMLAFAGRGFRLAQMPSLVSRISAGLELDHVISSVDDRHREHHTALSAAAVEVILWELLENAKRFHPEGAPTIEVAATLREGSAVKLLVSDNGLTLSSNQLSRAWMPYFRGEQGAAGVQPGMGLGLAVVASLLWQVGGSCRIYNREPAPGLVVELHIPLEEA
jgi:two-component system, cell cycle response regulator